MNLDSISQELDRLYEFEISKYIDRCDELKKSGFKIYRNSTGQHKVVLAGQSSQTMQKQEDVYEARSDKRNVRRNAKKENIFVRAKNKVKRFIENVKTVVRFIKILQASQNNNKW